ncbi:MAG: hemolysin family protein [Acidobacteriota bacterium]
MEGSDTLLSFLVKLVVILLLVFANGFFVAAEFSLVGVRRSRVLALIEEGNASAKTLLRVISMLDAYISATQLGITLASLALGWLGEATLAHAFTPLFEKIMPHGYATGAAHTVAIVVAFTMITFLHIVLGELAPKTLALERTERTALLIARPMEIFYRIFKLPIWILNYSGMLVLRIFGLQANAEHAHAYTKEELRQLVEMSHQGGHLLNEEMLMLHNIIEFSNTEVREVMVPRTEICALSDKTSIEEVYKTFSESGFSRLPVYHERLDNIIGILFLKDVVPYLRQSNDFSIARLLNRPLYLPETAHLGEALRQMRRARVHMAIVVDEYGGTLGVVTLENVLEQIVGEIQDEYDDERASWVVEEQPGVYTLNGGVTIKAINKRLKLELPEEDGYTTLAGFLMAQAGQVLKPGQHVTYGPFRFTITKAERFRITEVLLQDNRTAHESTVNNEKRHILETKKS